MQSVVRAAPVSRLGRGTPIVPTPRRPTLAPSLNASKLVSSNDRKIRGEVLCMVANAVAGDRFARDDRNMTMSRVDPVSPSAGHTAQGEEDTRRTSGTYSIET